VGAQLPGRPAACGSLARLTRVPVTRRLPLRAQSYEGGFGLSPGLEAHGGSTYCGVAALALMGALPGLDAARRARLVRWCVGRQVGGFQVCSAQEPREPVAGCVSSLI
jgi:hypothetical protein